MSILRVLACSMAMVLFLSSTALADIDLPEPQKEGGMGLFEALNKRSSAPGGDFSTAQVSLEELSTILWAATGKNRNGNGWTVPMAKGVPPYCRIYVAGPDGIFLYDPEGHILREISSENIKAKIGAQSFVRKAHFSLIIVSDGLALSEFGEAGAEFAYVLAGAMTQDIYLAAAALKLGTRYIHSMNREEIISGLNLPAQDKPICLMLLGK